MLTIHVLADGVLVPVDLEPAGQGRDDRAAMYADLFGEE